MDLLASVYHSATILHYSIETGLTTKPPLHRSTYATKYSCFLSIPNRANGRSLHTPLVLVLHPVRTLYSPNRQPTFSTHSIHRIRPKSFKPLKDLEPYSTYRTRHTYNLKFITSAQQNYC